tara:strand:- start:186 stop:611 length:426 start_codon:yes stop_codon:yes gene_type:complete
MIIQYEIETGKIMQAAFGADDFWSEDQTVGLAEGCRAAKVDDNKNTAFLYYNETDKSLNSVSHFNIAASSDTVVADGSSYIEFTGIPEGSKVYVDESLIGEMDSSGIYRFSCTDVGGYSIIIKKFGYEWYYKGVNSYVDFE